MPTDRIPLVGSYNQRGLAGSADLTANRDQRFLNCTFNLVQNPITQKATIFVERRPGWTLDSVVSNVPSTALIHPQSFNATVTAFGETNSTIYWGPTSVGVITGRALHFTETIVGGVTYVMIKSSDGTGWYYASGAKDTLTYTGDTHTNTTVDNLGSTAGMYSGQKLSGAGIVAGTRIASVDSATAITLDTATSATAAGVTITKEPIAKIVDSNFITTGTSISAFAEMDGFLFYTTDDGNVRNSNLNSVSVFPAAGNVQPNMAPDPPVGLARHKNNIIVLGSASKEVFYNAGLATGSPLQRSPQYFDRIGALDQRSITAIENDVFFVSSPYEGDVGVYRIRDLAASRVSTPNVDRIIGTAAIGGAIYANSFRLGGYPYASFSLSLAADSPSSMLLLESGDDILLESGFKIILEDTPGQSASFIRMLVFNSALGLWSEWDCNMATFIDGVSSGTSNQLFASSRFDSEGNVYTINPASLGEVWIDEPTNSPVTFACEIRTARIDHGTAKRKFIQGARLVSDQQTAGTVSLYFSDDNYVTWQGPFTFDLTQARPQVQRLGSHRGGRAYKLVHQYNGPFRAEAIEIDYVVEE